MRTSTLALVATLVLSCGFAHAEDLIARKELQRGDTDASGKMETIMSEVRLMPGAHIPRHTHPGDEFAYVLAGGDMETPDGKVVNFPDGMNLHFPRGQVHGGVTSRADGEVVLLTVHVVDKGKPITTVAE